MAKSGASKGLPKRTGKASSKAKRDRHFARLGKKKDYRVFKSSGGKFLSRAELAEHNEKKCSGDSCKACLRAGREAA